MAARFGVGAQHANWELGGEGWWSWWAYMISPEESTRNDDEARQTLIQKAADGVFLNGPVLSGKIVEGACSSFSLFDPLTFVPKRLFESH